MPNICFALALNIDEWAGMLYQRKKLHEQVDAYYATWEPCVNWMNFRTGITELQLNKYLQRIGFGCIRVRMRSIDRFGQFGDNLFVLSRPSSKCGPPSEAEWTTGQLEACCLIAAAGSIQDRERTVTYLFK